MQSSEYARRSRLSVINCQHMLVCVEWAWYHVKPGGTAGSFLSQQRCRDGFFVFYDPFKEGLTDETDPRKTMAAVNVEREGKRRQNDRPNIERRKHHEHEIHRDPL